MLKTVDGGKTITNVKGIHHGDHHDVWIDPKSPKRMIAANDGGVDVSTDGGATWYAPMLPISQFYHVATDTSVPYRVFGAMQDLGTRLGAEQQPLAPPASRTATGTRSAAGRRATRWPTPRTPTSCTRASTSAS